MDVYMFKAALYCEPCGLAIRTRLLADGTAPANPHDETSYDSDDYPKGPFEDSISDIPDYCESCGEFLENDLTEAGRHYVRMKIRENFSLGHGRVEVLKQWAEFYGITITELLELE